MAVINTNTSGTLRINVVLSNIRKKNILLHFYHNLVILSNLYTKISLAVSDAIKNI